MRNKKNTPPGLWEDLEVLVKNVRHHGSPRHLYQQLEKQVMASEPVRRHLQRRRQILYYQLYAEPVTRLLRPLLKFVGAVHYEGANWSRHAEELQEAHDQLQRELFLQIAEPETRSLELAVQYALAQEMNDFLLNLIILLIDGESLQSGMAERFNQLLNPSFSGVNRWTDKLPLEYIDNQSEGIREVYQYLRTLAAATAKRFREAGLIDPQLEELFRAPVLLDAGYRLIFDASDTFLDPEVKDSFLPAKGAIAHPAVFWIADAAQRCLIEGKLPEQDPPGTHTMS